MTEHGCLFVLPDFDTGTALGLPSCVCLQCKQICKGPLQLSAHICALVENEARTFRTGTDHKFQMGHVGSWFLLMHCDPLHLHSCFAQRSIQGYWCNVEVCIAVLGRSTNLSLIHHTVHSWKNSALTSTRIGTSRLLAERFGNSRVVSQSPKGIECFLRLCWYTNL